MKKLSRIIVLDTLLISAVILLSNIPKDTSLPKDSENISLEVGDCLYVNGYINNEDIYIPAKALTYEGSIRVDIDTSNDIHIQADKNLDIIKDGEDFLLIPEGDSPKLTHCYYRNDNLYVNLNDIKQILPNLNIK